MGVDGDVEVVLDIEHAGTYGGRNEPEDQQPGDWGICKCHCEVKLSLPAAVCFYRRIL